MPTMAERAMIIDGRTRWAISNTTIVVGHNIWIDWNTVMTRRRSERSASAPPTRVSSNTGAFIANESSPIKNDEAPRVSSSQGSATCWAQVPMLERRLANQKLPKRRVVRSLSDSRSVSIAEGFGGAIGLFSHAHASIRKLRIIPASSCSRLWQW